MTFIGLVNDFCKGFWRGCPAVRQGGEDVAAADTMLVSVVLASGAAPVAVSCDPCTEQELAAQEAE
ncbi:hypothetical protein [Emcibacter sp.]|uniref:hypothetical protein n=1 Tax=Emcibacter sp. TaxID=1979954 RepID=UPI002AA76760|nr:hypothetical protein [Emcibacter sp.]